MIFGDERRGANSSCILALIQLKMDSAKYNGRAQGLLVGRGAPLHNGRRARSARNVRIHDPEPCARPGHGGLLRKTCATHTTHPTTPLHDLKWHRHGGAILHTHQPRRDTGAPFTHERARGATHTHVHEHRLSNQLT